MKRGTKRGLFRTTLSALVISLSSSITPTYARETRPTIITINRRKYHITKDKTILDERGNRITNQRTLGQVIETYLLSQELPEYKRTAQNNLRKFNSSRTKTQLKNLLNSYGTVLRGGISPRPLLNGTIQTFTNIYVLDPKMHLYTEITSDLRRAESNYRKFIRLIDKADLTDYREAKTMFNLLLQSEPVIKAATYSFKKIKDSKNPQLRIQERDKKEFIKLLNQKETKQNKRMLQRKRKFIYNRVKTRAKRTTEARVYEQIKKQVRNKLEQKLLKNIAIRFYFNR